MHTKNKVFWITRTAIFIAMLVVIQITTAPMGNTILTGSIVNLLLIVSAMICGPVSGLLVGAVSPVMARFLGIGPLWSLIPFIIAGNAALVCVWHILGNRNIEHKHAAGITALLYAAIAKFLVLYIGIVRIMVPVFLGLPEQQAAVISAMFSFPQLVTALIGGALAHALLPSLKKQIIIT